MDPKLLLLAAGSAVGLFFLAKPGTASAKASAVPGGAPGSLVAGFPQDLLEAEAQALASGDPVRMRQVADQVEARGFPAQAKTMREAAIAVQTTISSTPPAGMSNPTANSVGIPQINVVKTAAGVPAQQIPAIQVTVPANAPPADSVTNKLARAMALDLMSAAPGRENRTLVSQYQTQEKSRGFYVGNIDGLYGPKSALALMNDQNLVPPTPRVWPKANPAAAKSTYKAALFQRSTQDPPRAEEWIQAAAAVR